jgi:hypothetical protein
MVGMEAMARTSSTGASNAVLATMVPADEVVAMYPEGPLVE